MHFFSSFSLTLFLSLPHSLALCTYSTLLFFSSENCRTCSFVIVSSFLLLICTRHVVKPFRTRNRHAQLIERGNRFLSLSLSLLVSFARPHLPSILFVCTCRSTLSPTSVSFVTIASRSIVTLATRASVFTRFVSLCRPGPVRLNALLCISYTNKPETCRIIVKRLSLLSPRSLCHRHSSLFFLSFFLFHLTVH